MIETNNPIAGAVYRCDSGYPYLIHFISKHTNTEETVVVYERLNNSNAIQHCPENVQHCSVDQFMEPGKFTLVKRPALIPMD